ncbi:MAG: integrase core domain-containing protein [Bdellovibrionales bacterium]|nr:integrase core domain-containing protein [Bdellovibrionales bacterium]
MVQVFEFLGHAFRDLEHAQKKIETWRRYYTEERPHSALDTINTGRWKFRLARIRD